MKTITRTDLWDAIQKKDQITVIEALSQEEFDKGHISGALRLTEDEADSRAPKLLTNKDARIAVFCANAKCDASPNLVRKLTSLGYSNVADYREGKADWISAGHPVVSFDTTIKT
jgi:rhodanese-related sulfurtransferase